MFTNVFGLVDITIARTSDHPVPAFGIASPRASRCHIRGCASWNHFGNHFGIIWLSFWGSFWGSYWDYFGAYLHTGIPAHRHTGMYRFSAHPFGLCRLSVRSRGMDRFSAHPFGVCCFRTLVTHTEVRFSTLVTLTEVLKSTLVILTEVLKRTLVTLTEVLNSTSVTLTEVAIVRRGVRFGWAHRPSATATAPQRPVHVIWDTIEARSWTIIRKIGNKIYGILLIFSMG